MLGPLCFATLKSPVTPLNLPPVYSQYLFPVSSHQCHCTIALPQYNVKVTQMRYEMPVEMSTFVNQRLMADPDKASDSVHFSVTWSTKSFGQSALSHLLFTGLWLCELLSVFGLQKSHNSTVSSSIHRYVYHAKYHILSMSAHRCVFRGSSINEN